MKITKINSDCSLIEFIFKDKFYHVHINPASYWQSQIEIEFLFDSPLHISTKVDMSWDITSQELQKALESFKDKFIKNFDNISADIVERYGSPAWEPEFCLGDIFPDARKRIDAFL